MSSSAEQAVIDRARHPEFSGDVPGATHQAKGANLSCGDEVSFTLRIDEGIIAQIAHQSRACSICTAAADLLAQRLTAQPVQTIDTISNEEILGELEIPLSPMRQKCALLPLQALKTGLDSLAPDQMSQPSA